MTVGQRKRQPKLDRELTLHMKAEVIRHPLMTAAYSRGHTAVFNQMVSDKRRRLVTAKRDGDWRTYIWLHEREFRPAILWQMVEDIPPERFWILVGQVWHDAETIHPNRETWLAIWSSDRPFRDRVMTAEEHVILRDTRDTRHSVKVYRGFSTAFGKEAVIDGLSWTFDFERAKNYGRRQIAQRRSAMLATGEVAAKDIIAYFNRREEDVIILPQSVTNVTLRTISGRFVR
jgi:hypothetical protein